MSVLLKRYKSSSFAKTEVYKNFRHKIWPFLRGSWVPFLSEASSTIDIRFSHLSKFICFKQVIRLEFDRCRRESVCSGINIIKLIDTVRLFKIFQHI